MGSSPLVSVLMPTYNAARWLPATVECVLGQSWPNIELIVVDDGSRDATVEVARRFAGPRVQVIAQTNAGASAARQRALDEAQGEFVQYLDADDLMSPDKIERQIREVEAGEPDRVATCCWARFFTPVPEGVRGTREPVWADLAPVDWVVASAMGGGMMPIHAWLTPRAVVERAGKWPEFRAPNDDGEYFTRAVLSSSGVKFVDGVWAYYRSGVGGWSGARTPTAVAGMYAAIEAMAEALLRSEDSERTRAAAATMFQRFVHDVYPDGLDEVARAEARASVLGGSSLKAPGGPAFRAVSRLVGWKLARRIQRGSARYRRRMAAN